MLQIWSQLTSVYFYNDLFFLIFSNKSFREHSDSLGDLVTPSLLGALIIPYSRFINTLRVQYPLSFMTSIQQCKISC